MWRCLLNGQVAQEADTRAMCAHQPTAKPASSASGDSRRRSGTASALATNAPGWSPKRADLEDASANSSVVTRPPIMQQDERGVAAVVSRARARTSPPEQRIETPAITRSATTFMSASDSVQSTPSSGDDRIACTRPPVTTFGRPDRQDHEAPEDRVMHHRGPDVAEHPDLDEHVLDHAPRRGAGSRAADRRPTGGRPP